MRAIYLNIPNQTSDVILTMEKWRVFETERCERHLVGYFMERQSWRISSAIAAFGPEQRLMVTQSARVYVLAGQPSDEQHANLAWERWAVQDQVPAWRDVTDEISAQCEKTSASTRPLLH